MKRSLCKLRAGLLALLTAFLLPCGLRGQEVQVQDRPATAPTLSWRPHFLSDDASGFVVVTDGSLEPVALLTREAAEALKKASDILSAQGYRLKIFDAYRPQSGVDHFKRWARDPSDTRMKPYFYPDVDKSQLFVRGYVASHSGHSRGSTVDLTILEMATGKEVDMGGPFDFLGPRSHVDCPDITAQQQENRMILRRAMMQAGFRPYEKEWWHFTLRGEPYPDTYFTFPVRKLR